MYKNNNILPENLSPRKVKGPDRLKNLKLNNLILSSEWELSIRMYTAHNP